MITFARSAVISGLLISAACSTDLQIDVAGYACDPGGVCPAGFSCVLEVCQPTVGDGQCANVTCTQASQCNGNAVKTFAGTCAAATGRCSFVATETACPKGCVNGACIDVCSGVTCSTPPASTCSGSTSHAYQPTGTCNTTTGSCDYVPVETTCTGGCNADAGTCIGSKPCDGVICNLPPEPSCVGLVARVPAASGTCSAAGNCTYSVTETTCPVACDRGVCVGSSLATFKQIGPRLGFAITAIDIAPGSNGALVLAAGKNGEVARWNGSDWAVLTTPSRETINAVHFVTSSAAWLVGTNRTVWTYRAGTVIASASVPGASTANLVSVFGKGDASVLIANDTGGWLKWSGASWASGTLLGGKGPYQMRSAFIDETNRERIGGKCGTSAKQTCVAYRDPSSGLDWGIDLDMGSESSGCVAMGPFVDPPPPLQGPDVLCGKPSNELRRHTPYGFSLLSAPVVSDGNGVVGIAGGAGRASYVLTSSSGVSSKGVLHRLTRAGVAVQVDQLLTTHFGEEHLSLNEANGVVVADVSRSQGVNDVYRRSASTNEALDLGEDWAAVSTSSLGEFVLISTSGDVALQRANSPVFVFNRGPAEVSAVGAAAQGGTGVLIVGSNAVTGAGLIERAAIGIGFTEITTNAPNTTFNSVCRVSDAEAYAVGTGGSIYSVRSNNLTATKMTSGTVKDLIAVDCPSAGKAVACGKDGTVLRLAGGSWSAVGPPLPGMPRLTGCRLLGETVWVIGESTFARLDQGDSAWSMLPSRSGLRGLFIRSPTDVYSYTLGIGTTDIQRFDGSTWRVALQVRGMLRGGVQISSKVLLGGTSGLLVQGQ